jgi:ABC-type sugar transport system substrate-binding protein
LRAVAAAAGDARRNHPAVALAAMIREKLPTICFSLIVIAIPFLNTMQFIIAQATSQIK